MKEARTRTILKSMINAIDAVEPEDYWKAFETLLKAHKEMLDEIAMTEQEKLKHCVRTESNTLRLFL